MSHRIVSIVNELIQISLDGKQGFINASEECKRQDLKEIFTDKAAGCDQAAQNLQNYLTKFDYEVGDEIKDSGSVLGKLHRGWMAIKSMITEHDDHAILEECERGEDAAKLAYRKALEEETLPSDLRSIIQSQYEGVISNHDLVRDLRNASATN